MKGRIFMNMFKKIICKFVTIVIVLSLLQSSVYAVDSSQNFENSNMAIINETRSANFLSEAVPQIISEYAIDYFKNLTKSELVDLSFDNEEITNLKLCNGIKSYTDSTVSTNLGIYYFPVMSNGNVVAMLTVYSVDGNTLSAQFGKSIFANELNKLKATDNDYIVMTTDDEILAVDDNSTITILENFGDDEINNFNFNEYINSSTEIVSVNSIYDYRTSNISLCASYSIKEKYLNIPIVPNNNTTAFPTGICWASSAASIIKWVGTMQTSAINIRDQLVSAAGNPPKYVGYDYQIVKLLQKYTKKSYLLVSHVNSNDKWMSLGDIKNAIDTSHPIYTDWQTTSGAHAMVIRGYYDNSSVPGTDGKRVSLMDPNKTSYQSIKYGDTYLIGGKLYHLYSSIY